MRLKWTLDARVPGFDAIFPQPVLEIRVHVTVGHGTGMPGNGPGKRPAGQA